MQLMKEKQAQLNDIDLKTKTDFLFWQVGYSCHWHGFTLSTHWIFKILHGKTKENALLT